MFAPVRQSPTWNWLSCRLPTVGVALALGEALCDRLWVGLTVGPPAAALCDPGLSARTSATTITRMAAAAPTGISHLGRPR